MPDTLESRAPLAGSSPPTPNARAIAAVLIAVALASLDTAIANTALPTIAVELHVTPSASVWIINAYQLAMVAALLPFAALGKRIGHRRVFLGGVIAFVLASLLCALASSLGALAGARLIQGGGGAAVMSVNIALIRFLYPADRLGRGVGLNALVVGVAFAIGPTVASLVLMIASWPWLFAINLPLGLLALYFGVPTLPETPRRVHGLDPLAALFNVITFSALVFALGQAAQHASSRTVMGALAVAVVVGALLIRRETGQRAPMLPVDLFRRPMFALSALTAVCSFATQGLAFVSLPFYFENVAHRTQIETGFLMTPWPVLVAAVAPFTGRLADRYSPGLLGGIGLAILSAGMVLLATMPANASVIDTSLRMALCGLGFGFFQSPNLKALMSSAPPERSGGASGVIGTVRLLGQATGAALVALSFHPGGHHGPTLALAWGAGFAAVGCVASGLRVIGSPLRL
jgi:DHA2 family multidrug resistance protein-like MFS transporter